jgi:hypothetical protein
MMLQATEKFRAWNMSILLSIFLLFSPTAFAAVNLNGDADYINYGDVDSMEGASNMTISAWFKSSASVTVGIINKRRNSGAFDGWHIRVNSTGTILGFLWYTSGSSNLSCQSTTATFLDGNWHHVLFEVVSDTCELFVDGVSEATDLISSGSPGLTDQSVQIGTAINTASFMNGQITEVYFWDAVLDDWQRDVLQKSNVKGIGKQFKTSNLRFYAPLDDFANASSLNKDAGGYKDRSGNTNNGQGVDADSDSTNAAEEFLSYP